MAHDVTGLSCPVWLSYSRGALAQGRLHLQHNTPESSLLRRSISLCAAAGVLVNAKQTAGRPRSSNGARGGKFGRGFDRELGEHCASGPARIEPCHVGGDAWPAGDANVAWSKEPGACYERTSLLLGIRGLEPRLELLHPQLASARLVLGLAACLLGCRRPRAAIVPRM